LIGNVVKGHAVNAYTARYGNPCHLDRTTDAIVPFVVTTTNTTSGDLTASGDQKLEIVNASLGVAPHGSDSPKGAQGTQSDAGFAAGEALKAVEDSSSGSKCANLDPPGEAIAVGNDALTKGQASVLKGYFELKGWSHGGSQDGDSSWLSNIWILVPNSGNGWETASVNGPALVSLLDYTPAPTYDPSKSYGSKSAGYGWVFPIDGKSEPDCASAASTSPSGSLVPSVQALCEALPEEIVMGYLNTHAAITSAIARSLTGVRSESTLTSVLEHLRANGEIELVPGKSGSASEWRKKASG
jgi:hypothetical protein